MESLLPSLRADCNKLLPGDFIFQQDGAPAHTALLTQTWIAGRYHPRPTNISVLEVALQLIWNELPQDPIQCRAVRVRHFGYPYPTRTRVAVHAPVPVTLPVCGVYQRRSQEFLLRVGGAALLTEWPKFEAEGSEQ